MTKKPTIPFVFWEDKPEDFDTIYLQVVKNRQSIGTIQFNKDFALPELPEEKQAPIKI